MLQKAKNSHAPDLLYKHIQNEVYTRTIHPLKASSLIATAIENGHQPPESHVTSRHNLRHLIKRYVRRDMCSQASDEIARCLARGLVDEYTLLRPIADDYINCLLSTRAPDLTAVHERAKKVNQAVQFLTKLHSNGLGKRVLPKTYDRLLEAMYECPDYCTPAAVLTIAVECGIPLDKTTRRWNMRLHKVAMTRPMHVLECFHEVTLAGVKIDEYTISILLRCLRHRQDCNAQIQHILGLAHNLGLYNEFVAIEEMNHLKTQRKYQALLKVFADAYGPEVLLQFGFLSPRVETSSSNGSKLQVTKQSLSLMLDALVRLNPSPKNLKQLWIAYLKFRRYKKDFWNDVHSTSIFIRAFSNSPKTIGKALVNLERMRTNRVKPNVVTYTNVIDGFVKNNMMDLAAKVLRYMHADGVEANAYTWRILLRGYLNIGNQAAAETCREMLDRLQPNQQQQEQSGNI